MLANDADSAPNAQLLFSIMSGDDNVHFSIDGNSGYIKVAKTLDREMVFS